MTTLSFSVIGRDVNASKVLQNVSKHATGTAKSFHALKVGAGIALVAVAGAVVKFGTSSVRAYTEAQTAQLKLQDAFRRFPRLADTNQAALQRLNTELQKKTKFDDDATASGQAVLAQFKLTGQQITQLTPLLQDYAAKTGKDLPTAARDLGKAVLGQGRSLKAVGIDFKDTGTHAGNLDQIMKGLRTQVGGFATQEGKSAAGQAAILKNQFGELQESVGKLLLPALTKVVGGLGRVVGFIQDNSAVFGTFAKTVKVVFGSIIDSIFGGQDAFRVFADFIATHQEDITQAIIAGGKAFVVLGKALATQAALGLRAIAMLADGQALAMEQMLGSFGAMAHGAALAFGWIPGIGAKFKAADVAFARFSAGAVGGLRAAAGGARGLADGIDKKLLPGLNKAGTGLDALGKKAIASAHARDIVAKAEINHRHALDAATASVKLNGKALDRDTVAGRNNRAALNGLVTSSQAYIGKLIATHASSKRVTAATVSARAEFVRVARQMGLSKKEAEKLATAYFKIPKKVVTNTSAPGAVKAKNQMKDVHTEISKLTGKHVNVGITVNSTLDKLNKAAVRQFGKGAFKAAVADGGPIPGYSPHPKADNIPIMATAREFMQPVSAVDYYGVGTMKKIQKRQIPREALQHLADGGTVSRDVVARVNAAGVVYNYAKIRDAVASGTSAATRAGTSAAVHAGAAAAVKAGVAAAKKAQAASMVTLGGASSFSGKLPGGTGAAGIRAIARALGASYIAAHRDPQGGPAFDLGSSGAKNNRIAAALISQHGRLGLRYVIHRMLIASARSGWRNRAYHPITGSGDFRHVNHVHVSYDKGGMLHPGGIGINAGRRPERILSPGQTKSFDNLVRVLDRRGGAVVHNHYTVNAPHYVGNQQDLVNALVKLDSRGQLAVIKRSN